MSSKSKKMDPTAPAAIRLEKRKRNKCAEDGMGTRSPNLWGAAIPADREVFGAERGPQEVGNPPQQRYYDNKDNPEVNDVHRILVPEYCTGSTRGSKGRN